MEIMFSYIDSRRLDALPASLEQQRGLSLADFPPECLAQAQFFSTLIGAFHSRVLPTLRCKFVQFLVFYACAKQPPVYGRMFVSALLKLFRFETRAIVTFVACTHCISTTAPSRRIARRERWRCFTWARLWLALRSCQQPLFGYARVLLCRLSPLIGVFVAGCRGSSEPVGAGARGRRSATERR